MKDRLRPLLPSAVLLVAWILMSGLAGVLVAPMFVNMGPVGTLVSALAAVALAAVAVAVVGLTLGWRPAGVLVLAAGLGVLVLVTGFLIADAVASRRDVERYRRPAFIEKTEEEPAPAGAENAGAAASEGDTEPGSTPGASPAVTPSPGPG